MKSDRDEIRALLLGNAERLARDLAPEGHRSGRYWMARCPWRDDRRAGSFWITVAGPFCGAWKDAATDDKGDVFDLVDRAVGHNGDFGAVLAWSRKWLGLEHMSDDERRRRAAVAEARQRDDGRRAAAELDRKRRLAFGLFVASRTLRDKRPRPFLGSVADRYLQGRGIHVAALGRMPGALGWLPAGAWGTRHAESGGEWPVMVAGLSDPQSGRIVAVHRTFLAPDGSGKAAVDPVRKIWPSFAGCAIRLWRGGSGLSVEDAEKHGLLETLAICEGVEDGLAIALAMPDWRVWCAGSLGNLGEIRLPRSVDRVIVAADNDWGKPQAQRQLDKALDALARQGPEIHVARSPVGKDVNDCLLSK